MFLTPEVVEYCKKELKLQNDFEPADTVTANHILFEQWRQKTQRFKFAKFIFYIIMDEIYGESHEKDANGDLGRRLKMKE
jgi:hypothetical protein